MAWRDELPTWDRVLITVVLSSVAVGAMGFLFHAAGIFDLMFGK